MNDALFAALDLPKTLWVERQFLVIVLAMDNILCFYREQHSMKPGITLPLKAPPPLSEILPCPLLYRFYTLSKEKFLL